MVDSILSRGKKLITGQQSSILSAATIIMFMIVVARVLGLVRQRILATYFGPEEISIFFAAFRLPDSIFEVLVFGTFSSAFIPVFTKTFDKDEKSAWALASRLTNLGLLFFVILAFVVLFFAHDLYAIISPGYSDMERAEIVRLTKVLFAAQGFFVLSYVLTGVLESMRRFLIPALAPVFYNIGIIFGIIFLSGKYGLLGPALGVLVGALGHFLIQLPLAVKLGYRVTTSFRVDKNIRKIARLAAPRVVEISFNQVVKSTELFIASFISTAAYAYYTLGNSIQLIPVGIFGTSIAKAALPTLAKLSHDTDKFKKSLWSSFSQVVFLVIPVATILIILRVPVTRLIYGTQLFDWESTIQTGYVVSAFSFGVVFQATAALLARSFYALQDTKTPVKVSVASMFITIALNVIFVRGLNLPVWGLAVAFSIGSAFQATSLFFLIKRKLNHDSYVDLLKPAAKSLMAALGSGAIMYLFLKFFDRSVWVKRLSFLTDIEATKNLPFEKFVLDTRYTVNLLILTVAVSVVGGLVYIILSIFLKSKEVWTFFNLLRRVFVRRKIVPIPKEEQEPVTPDPGEVGEQL